MKPPPLAWCAICQQRRADRKVDFDDKLVDCCEECASPVPEPVVSGHVANDSLKRRAIRMLQATPGLTSRQLADWMELPDHDRHELQKALGRAVRSEELVTSTARREERRFWPPECAPAAATVATPSRNARARSAA